ncbi:prostaglandin E synthase 2 [Diorhabda sublineata]|uniref:prostaglandin E synthase 2 n=1 Tax=Diorhabda sublineata TaxID=1163346 RepID=UPI0024E08B9B|nr:prostaglandin E synthase 2 [Diorhabda sublineata]
MQIFSKRIIAQILCSPCRRVTVDKRFLRNSSTTKLLKGTFRIGLTGITVGALLGTGYSIHYYNKPRAHILNEEITIPTVKEIPDIKPTRVIKNYEDRSGLELTLYQYQTCPFCCKVRAFLDYYGISYNVIEVDPVLRQAIKWSPYRKVPILVAKVDDGFQPLNDSTMIISALASYLFDNNNKNLPEIVKCFPLISYVDDDGIKKNEIMNRYFLMLNNVKYQTAEEINSEERKWRKWADNVLVHTLSPNVYRTKDEALQAFNWFSEVGEWEANFPIWERYLMIYVGASAMWLIGKKLKKRHNLKDDVRQSLYDECNYWLRAVKSKGGQFMGGSRPNLADLAVYGVLSSIEGCLAFKDLLENTKIGGWYYNMKRNIAQHEGATMI